MTATKNRTSLGFLALGVFLFIILLANAQAVTLGQSNLTDSIKLGSSSSTTGTIYTNNTYNNITIYNVTGGTYFATCASNQITYYINSTTIGCAENVTLYQSSIRVRDFASNKNADYQGDELSIGDAFDYFRFRVLGSGTSAINLSLQTGTVGNNWFDVNSKTRFNYNLTTQCVNFKDGTTQCSASTVSSTSLTNVAWRNESNNFSKPQQFNSNVSIGLQDTSRGIFDINNSATITIGNVPTITALSFSYGDDSDYWNAGYYYQYSIYAYKTVGSNRIYSATPITSALTQDNNADDNSYVISFSWGAVTGADGYRVVVNRDDYYGASNDAYFDTISTSVSIDGGYGSYGGQAYTFGVPPVTPTSLLSGSDLYMNSVGTLVSENGATFQDNVGIGTPTPVSKLDIFGANGADGSDVKIRLDVLNGNNDNGNGFIYVEARSNTTINAAGNMNMFYLLDKNPGSPYFMIENQNGAGTRVGYNLIGLRQTGAAFLQTGSGLRIETGGGGLGDIFTGKIGVGTATPTAKTHIAAGTATAGTAPIKFTSGTLTTVAVAGQMEYLTNDFYLTSATVSREKIITSLGLTSGRVPFVTTNGRLNDSNNFKFTDNNGTSGSKLIVDENNWIGYGAEGTTYAGIWLKTTTPSLTNYAFLADGTNTYINAPSGVYLRTGNTNRLLMDSAGVTTYGLLNATNNVETFNVTVKDNMTTKYLTVTNNLTVTNIITTKILRLNTNTTVVTCNVANAGALYWDNSTKTHYGCNSTNWRALY